MIMWRRCLALLALVILSSACPLPYIRSRWPSVPSAPSPPAPAPDFSVVWNKSDLNGVPYDPQWATQRDDGGQFPPLITDEAKNPCVREPYLSDCTAQHPSTDKPGFPMDVFCSLEPTSKVHGHVDWMPVAYHGYLRWIHVAVDLDYNFALFPDDSDGITKNNNQLSPTSARYTELEFDSLETGENFATPTWRKFADAAAQQNSRAIAQWLNVNNAETPPQAVVTGLLNLDCEHDCRSELHPVYAMAIETNDNLDDNTWAIFVRNWGNGGSCSSQDHQVTFSESKFVLVLPKGGQQPPSIITGSTEFATNNSGIQFPQTGYITGEGLVLSFTLPPPDKHALAELVLHLKWPAGTPGRESRRLLAAKVPPMLGAEAIPSNQGEAEGYLDSLFKNAGVDLKNLSSGGVKRFAVAAMPSNRDKLQPVPKTTKVKRYLPPKTRTAGSGQTAAGAPFTMNSPTDEAKLARDRALVKRLCDEYKAKGKTLPTDKIPSLPKVCESLEQNSPTAEANH